MKKITFLLFTCITMSLVSQTKLTSILKENNNGTSWQNSYKIEYIYDANGNVTEETELNWDTASSQWKTSYKSFYTYNTDNKATVGLYQSFDFTSGSITYQNRTNNTYNSNGDLIQFLDQEWNGSAWVNSYKFDLTYVDNRVSSGLSYEWSGTDWVFNDDASKITINYNANGTISSFNSDAWDGVNWVTEGRTVFSYDGNNKIILQDGQTWNGSAWTSDYKSEYTYDNNGNVIEEKESYLENGSFVTGYEQTATFNTAELISSYIHPFKDKTGIDYLTEPNGIVNKILTSSSGSDRTTYNYGDATASNKDFNLSSFSVYPNPTRSTLKIDDSNFSLKNVAVFNIIGKQVLTSLKNEINLEKLVNGVYVLKVTSKNGSIVTKRIVKN